MKAATNAPWRDRVEIAKHEITCAAIVISDFIERKNATEDHFARLTLCLQRLRALSEVRS